MRFIWSFYLNKNPKIADQVPERARNLLFTTYIENGAGADADFSEAQQISDMLRVDVGCCGFVVSGQWVPGQSGELLGYVLN